MAGSLTTQSAKLNEKLTNLRENYLDLMQRCLTGSIYRDGSDAPFTATNFNSSLRDNGLDWPASAQTMIGSKRMANLRELVESVIAENVPGDLIETGVWRGGACILMRAVLFANNITNRCVWVADSFEGLPVPNEHEYPADTGCIFNSYSQLAVSLEQVQENFNNYGLLDEQVKFLKGWFKDTLLDVPVEQFALIRLDGDMYESTMDALKALYPKLSHQGYVIIDDYHVVPACKAAVHDYCLAHSIQPEIFDIDGVGVYWKKENVSQHRIVDLDFSQETTLTEVRIECLNEAFIELNSIAINFLKRSLSERDVEMARLSQSLSERDVEMTRLSQNLSSLSQSLESIYASSSWQITKPIRVIKNIITAMKGS